MSALPATFNPAAQLKQTTTATRIMFNWLGMSCKMEDDAKEQMARVVDAEEESVGVTKKLYNRKLDCFKKIAKVKGEIVEYWKTNTLPYVEPGIRLLKRASLTEFHEKMTELQEKLRDAAQDVQDQRFEILEDARRRLQRAFNPANYPDDLSTLFNIEWSFPSIEPPNYLAQMNPQIYEQERQRAAARLEEAVALAEQAFLQEFKGIVAHLSDCLTPTPDGKQKVFKSSSVTNFSAFLDRFKALNIGSNQELETLVAQANELLAGIKPDELRSVKCLREDVQKGLSDINGKLDPLLVPKPRRAIIRPKKEPTLEPVSQA